MKFELDVSTASQVALLFALLLLGYVFVFSRQTSSNKGKSSSNVSKDSILLAGPSGSGKTALFYRIKTGSFRETVSSLKMNRTDSSFGKLIDYPGHERLRVGFEQVLSSAKVVVFMIDPSDRQQLKDGSEKLYDLLTSDNLTSKVIICLSKSDKEAQKSIRYLTQELEKEIDRMRKSRDDEGRYLGIDGQPFSFSNDTHLPVAVNFVSMSCKSGDVSALTDILSTI